MKIWEFLEAHKGKMSLVLETMLTTTWPPTSDMAVVEAGKSYWSDTYRAELGVEIYDLMKG
jgi:hypothetical protein